MEFHADYRSQGEYLRHDPELKGELQRRALLGLTIATALAPRLRHPTRNRVPGALAASGRVVDQGTDDAHHDHMALRVEFTIDYAAAATWPHNRRNPAAADYLRAAIPAMERG